MKKYCHLLVNILMCIATLPAWSQVANSNLAQPVIGQICPDFVFSDIRYLDKTKISVNDFRGKWLILDFWDVHCSGCIEGIPKYNKIQQDFKDKVQVLEISTDAKDDVSEAIKIYERLKKRFGLIMPLAMDTTVSLHNGFDRGVIVIDPNGTVRAMSWGVNYNVVKALLEGEAVDIPYKRPEKSPILDTRNYNPNLPLLTTGNKVDGTTDTSFIYRSMLVHGTKEMGHLPIPSSHNNLTQNLYEIFGTISSLYREAYSWRDSLNKDDEAVRSSKGSARYAFRPIFEIKDTSLLTVDNRLFFDKGWYYYSLKLPLVRLNYPNVLRILKQDLYNNFGFHVSIESRMMPCYRLVATPQAFSKLKSKSNDKDGQYRVVSTSNEKYKTTHTGLTYQNMSMLLFATFFAERALPAGQDLYYGEIYEPIVVNATGIADDEKIDVTTTGYTPEDMMKDLHNYGLDLVKGTVLRKVLVIRDGND